jgi:hypothetical protein
MSEGENRRIQELEGQVRDLHEILSMHIELSTKSANLIAELFRQKKPRMKEDDGEYLDLLVRSRAALVTCEDAMQQYPVTFINLDVLLTDLNKWFLRAERSDV